MAVRRFLRGRVPPETVEAVASAVVARDGEAGDADVDIQYLEADNWLSTPFVVGERWFVKVISPQNSLVHALLTTGRNLGAFSSGSEGFFEHFATPIQMADHELEATRRIRELGLNAPAPVETFEHDGLGVLVLEYLPAFRTLDDLAPDEAAGHAPALFAALARMHEAGIAHGDLREENVLVADDELFFIDATSVRGDAIADARAYDLASALGALAPHIGAGRAVAAALTATDPAVLLDAREFLDFVNLRPDHDFDAAELKGEIEKAAAATE